jgi:anti-sigma factor RsiW
MSEHIDRYTLDAYVEQALPAAERRAVEAHVTTCPACQARLAAAKQMPALLYQMPHEQPAPELATRIKAEITTRRVRSAPASSTWWHWLVLVMFVAGLGLLALAAPRWSGWLGRATAQLPNDQVILNWLGNLVSDPASALDAATAAVDQMATGAADEMDAMLILATVLLAAASIAALAQLLGGEQPGGTLLRVQV